MPKTKFYLATSKYIYKEIGFGFPFKHVQNIGYFNFKSLREEFQKDICPLPLQSPRKAYNLHITLICSQL